MCETKTGISIASETYNLPDVSLVTSDGEQVAFLDLINHDGPVVVQFAFTTCSTVCPVLSATTAEVQKRLKAKPGSQASTVRFITISIDPQHDSPAVLRDYKASLKADRGWYFLTGSSANIASIRKAFAAYTFNKSRHEALTFLKNPSGANEWTRVTGFISAKELTTRILELAEQLAPGDPDLGKRIYRDGMLPDGSKLTAFVSGDVPIRGHFASCARCHRNSGYGSDEPGKIVPAITASRLFEERKHERAEELRTLFQEPQTTDESTNARIPRNRPSYTDATLLAALREGHDPTGHVFGLLKPRYDLSDSHGRHLIAYLKTLGANHAAGVEADTIHFATIITDDVSSDAQASFLRTINAFVETRNREVTRYRSRPGLSPNYKSDLIPSFRKWQVHVWRLEGSPANYGLQLASHYNRRPVFAILSGLTEGDWNPIHRFCDHREVPCIFPITSRPKTNAKGGYTIYFDRGSATNRLPKSDGRAGPVHDEEFAHTQWEKIESNNLPRSFRIQAWFRARGVKLSHPNLQFKTHFALTVSSFAIGHMVERHGRDYFIERIEHETENALNPGTHARLSLGPGQRFASRSNQE